MLPTDDLNVFDHFTVFFYGDRVFLNGKEFPLGQCSVDVLNIEESLLTEIHNRISDFLSAVLPAMQDSSDETVGAAQQKLNAVWDVLAAFPVYRDLDLYRGLMDTLLTRTYHDADGADAWRTLLDKESDAHIAFEKFLNALEDFPQTIRNFQKMISTVTADYLELQPERTPEAFADGYAYYFNNRRVLETIAGEDLFDTSFETSVSFVPMQTENKDGVMIAEKTVFDRLDSFLYVEFYRGLVVGHAPRVCHNCGKFFLTTGQYKTVYCNNRAPGEKTRTCRQVGAHNIEKQKAKDNPIIGAYKTVYNRLKGRYHSGKLSVDEWNALVAKAQDVRDAALRGELTDTEMQKRFREF